MDQGDSNKRRRDQATWDEHQWDQFIQEQDRRAEKSLRLLQKYSSHPNSGVLNPPGLETGLPSFQSATLPTAETSADKEAPFPISAMAGELFDGDREEVSELDAPSASFPGDGEDWALLRQNPAYCKAHRFCREIHQYLPEEKEGEPPQQPIIDLMSHAYGITAKLAGGLGGSNMGEDLGMSIAYCKRCLREVQLCLKALRKIEDDKILPREHLSYLRQMTLEVREEVVSQIAVFRKLWRDRYES